MSAAPNMDQALKDAHRFGRDAADDYFLNGDPKQDAAHLHLFLDGIAPVLGKAAAAHHGFRVGDDITPVVCAVLTGFKERGLEVLADDGGVLQ